MIQIANNTVSKGNWVRYEGQYYRVAGSTRARIILEPISGSTERVYADPMLVTAEY